MGDPEECEPFYALRMNRPENSRRSPTIFFTYVKPLSFSGQSAATELIIEKLQERGWDCRPVHIHPLDRAIRNPLRRYGQFALSMIATWWRLWGLVLRKRLLLHVNLGQSLGSFVRLGVGYFPLRLLRPGARVVVSLHGSSFMLWQLRQWETRIFLMFLKSARRVTVLGERQKAKLIELGLAADKIQVVPNTCEIPVISEDEVEAKHTLGEGEPVRLLHLSLLIESKGYPEFLEALECLSQQALAQPIEAVLCGPMAFTAECTRFTLESAKEQWILDKVAKINENPDSQVSVEWIRGAFGEEKRRLFEESAVFVFPSRFSVEAQPLVLLEAMAAGCALITSTVGEIPSTVNERCALMLEHPTVEALVAAIKQLSFDADQRRSMALEGLSLIQGPFSPSAYADTWERIFNELQKN